MGSPRSNESSNVSSHCNCSETFYHKDCKSRHFPLHYSEIQAYDPEFVAHFPQFLAEGFGEGLFQISCHLEQVHQLEEQVQHEQLEHLGEQVQPGHLGHLEQLGEYGQLEQIGEHEELEQLGQFGKLGQHELLEQYEQLGEYEEAEQLEKLGGLGGLGDPG